MSSLPANSTPLKRRLTEEDPLEEGPLEEEDYLLEPQETENLSEAQPAIAIALSNASRRRGRPPKRNSTTIGRPVAETSGSAGTSTAASSSTTGAPQSSLSTNLPEFDLVLEAMSLKLRPGTAAAYRKPLEDWQDFCRKNRHSYPVDSQFPLTVGPTEFVLAFFRDYVMKRTYKKSISMETDVRTQIALRNDDNENDELTLLQTLSEMKEMSETLTIFLVVENAPVNKRGGKRVIDVPFCIEAVNQYKKVLMLIHDYQFEHRAIPGPSPKKTKELIRLIKKYERDLVYDQVQTNADRAAHCVIRDSYKSGELITMRHKNIYRC
ncbi:hypothetical protein V8B55DRAFT_1586480 [Mucor lusitanicus]|uniref:Uncharacterized protein n=2 Tax=Mucor circinelloides f. lusitanicus TaxID=29924 RepID=A0A168MUM2_MUCCL|nr:hypothetical protein FB192DRAFT_1433218 [Mucor lusitanicus]OAD05387.1 hypothetical protein MUCCIDRAFT_162077 [Mucor lusitanicus CBS 277.49]